MIVIAKIIISCPIVYIKFTSFQRHLASKYKTFVKHLYNVGSTSKTLGRRCIDVIQMFVYLIERLLQSQKEVSGHLLRKQILPFGFARQTLLNMVHIMIIMGHEGLHG